MYFTSRARIPCFCVVSLVFGAFVPYSSPADEPNPRPNIIIMLADDLGWGDVGFNGNRVIKTPNLDRLASEGLTLKACYAAAPVCSPSRAGLMTGRIPNRAAVYDWIPANTQFHLRREEVTIATLLSRAGYDTCHSGKWHLNGQFNRPQQPQPIDHGFGHWFSTQNNAAPSHLNPTNFVRNGQRAGNLEGPSSAVVVNEAIGWLKRRPDPKRPFFLYVCFHESHERVAAADEFKRLYPDVSNQDQREYFADVSQMDAAVGKLMAAVDELGARENTLVYFSSDNGPETLGRYQGSERSHGSPGPFRGMKLHLYEGGIREPGAIRWPARIKPGSTSDTPVSSVDLLPTLCELCGIDLPSKTVDGTSLVALFSGQQVIRKAPLYWQYDNAIGPIKSALRDGDWKVLASADLASFELYNLASDPSEKVDLAKREPSQLERMANLLRQTHASVMKEGFVWPAVTEPPGTAAKRKNAAKRK